MDFYKKREFGTLISDTFNFFKIYGKNYFRNYFMINGIPVVLFVMLFIFGYREFFMQLFAGNLGGETYYFEQYFENNLPMLVFLVFVLVILAILTTLVSYTFPVFYLKRISNSGNRTVQSDEILTDLKSSFGRLLLLMLGMAFVITPLLFVLYSVSIVLIFIIIGFFLLLVVVPVSLNIINFILYDYFNTKNSFFTSLSYAIRAQFSYSRQNEKSPFWKYWGTSIVILIINYIVTSIFSMVPMIILQTSLLTSPSAAGGFEDNPFVGTMGVIFFSLYAISMVVSFVLMNVFLVASGLMYYDNRTDLHQQHDMLEIDSIGTHEV